MPSGAKKRKAAKKAHLHASLRPSLQQDILSEQEVTTVDSVMPGEDDASMNEDIMGPLEVQHQQKDAGGTRMEAAPLTSEGGMSKAELDLDGAEADILDEKMASRNDSAEENTSILEQSTRRQQDVADEGTHASLMDIETSLEVRSENVSALVLPVSSNEDSHEHEEDCHLPCPCADNNPPRSWQTATILHEEDFTAKQLVLSQSSSPDKDHTDQRNTQVELSVASGWWGCCGIFDLLLGKS